MREAPERQGSVLIVEDEAELRFILTAHLRAAGFDVLEAADGATALKTTAEHMPDVIIMDIGLPVMDGLTATRALKSDPATSHIPIIMLTARSGSEDVVRGLDAGAQEYLPKPFEVAELLARVRTVYRLAVARRDLDRLNTHLEAEVDLKTVRLRTLYEFMRELNRVDAREQILDLIVGCVQQLTRAQRISVQLTDPTGNYLVCERALGIDAALVERVPLDAAQGIAGQVFRTGTTLAARTYGATICPERRYISEAFISTPLISTSLATREGIIGVLNVTDKPDQSPFSEDEVDCIRSIADAAAIALHSAARRLRLEDSVRVLLRTVGHLAEYRDEETTLHLERVSRMARILAEEVQRHGPYASSITEEWIDMLVQATPLHDIGKVGIPDEILTKPGELTVEEFNIMKSHTDIGRRVLSRALDPAFPNPLLQMCIDIAHCHHERYDGRGYPRRLAKSDIPLAARMVTLVDAYDAITSHRRYKSARSHLQAVEVIREESGRHFDPVLVDAFLRCEQRFDLVRERYEERCRPKPLRS